MAVRGGREEGTEGWGDRNTKRGKEKADERADKVEKRT